MAGHWAAVGLLAAAGAAFVVWLIARPPRDARAAAWRLAIGLAAMFTLAPATRWGYFVYPIALVGWLLLTRPPAVTRAPPIEIGAQAARERTWPAVAR
jgi:hypothetical protein